jgi:osmotically-inducible protein OsmY
MKTDAQLKKDVTSELEWDPSIDATNVGVAVKGGVVTLTGHLDTYGEKFAIERALQRVGGVRAIALELDVKLAPGHQHSDAEIAAAVETAFKWHVLIPVDQLRVQVEKGWVTVTGEVEWDYQRRAAEKAVRPLTGVIGVTNSVTLRQRIAPANIANRIRDALTRQAAQEAAQIEVKVSGTTATLRGSVRSWGERSAAQGATWSAPGIVNVVNELEVGSRRDNP